MSPEDRQGQCWCGFLCTRVRSLPNLWGRTDSRRAIVFITVLRLITATSLSRENTVLKAHLAPSWEFLRLVLDIKHHYVMARGHKVWGGPFEFPGKDILQSRVWACDSMSRNYHFLSDEGKALSAGPRGGVMNWVKRQNKKPNKRLNKLSDDEEVNWVLQQRAEKFHQNWRRQAASSLWTPQRHYTVFREKIRNHFCVCGLWIQFFYLI